MPRTAAQPMPKMKTHLAVMCAGLTPGSTITSTLCGRENALSEDGTNSSEDRSAVDCKFCLQILAQPKHWRMRKFQVEAA